MQATNKPDSVRILYIVGQLSYGGLERQLHYLLQGMDRERYRPAVLVWNSCGMDGYAPDIRALGIPLYGFSHPVSRMAKLLTVRRVVAGLRPEIVHSFSFYTNYAAHFGAWNTSALAIGSQRSDIVRDRRRTGTLVGLLSARWPHTHISNNASTIEHIRKSNSWLVPKRVLFVPNGVDVQTFRDYGQSNGKNAIVVGIGSLRHVKRWDRLLRAIRKLKERQILCELRLAGDGPLRQSLHHLAEALGIQQQVTFRGYVSDIPRFISDGSFLVHTADVEGCPNAVLEAMACGRAVVATNAGDVPYLVEDGETGYIVDREDEDRLAECMAALIQAPDLRCSFGQKARAKAEREFTTARFVQNMIAAYREASWKD